MAKPRVDPSNSESPLSALPPTLLREATQVLCVWAPDALCDEVMLMTAVLQIVLRVAVHFIQGQACQTPRLYGGQGLC